MTDREWIQQSVEKNADMLTKVSDAIWEYAELPFQETRSAALLMQRLQERGFTVKSGLAGMPTCFTGAYTAGSGGPVVGFLGEYDALSGLSQAPGQPVKAPVTPGGNGHGCGHCALGAGALGAAIALKDYLDATGKKRHGDLLWLPSGGRGGLQAVYGPCRPVRRGGFRLYLAPLHRQQRGGSPL